ncbi:MAG TPA: type I-U CRISPR-associated RAMP protein Csb1/Cas7u [Planctomycetota bacterium]|nr:type I-U CRISPR-associated RAMP protein Csb1/Cas7u [Planctomycetota bacterium]
MAQSLTLDDLRKMVEGDVVAIRGRATLQPAGGPGDKVFPPSHSVEEKAKLPAGAKYAFETRRRGGEDVRCVLLDSVQSQANRMEEALQSLWEDKRIRLPVVAVNLEGVAPELGRVTSLTAPHRIADALLRDSIDSEKRLFRVSPLGKSFADATPRRAEPLFKVCPTGLVFGIWDSTGPKGGLGAKFARALTSEIVGIDARPGVKTSSRIDPTGIVTKAAEIFEAADAGETWTHDPKLAKKKADKPVKFGDGKTSEINHSNIPPTIEDLAGGVTVNHAEQTVVLSVATIRRLGFAEGASEARVVLCALGLLAVAASQNRGHDLRSRCLLVPTDGGLRLETVAGDGRTSPLHLGLEEAITLYNEAVKSLPKSLAFTSEPGEALAILEPTPKLGHLIKESRRLAAAGGDDGAE